MRNLYNDNPIINDEVALKLKHAYDEKLNKVKMQSAEDNYLHLAHICVDILNEARNIIFSLQNNSKNLEMKQKLDEILNIINEHLEKLNNLYIDINFNEDKLEYNYNSNLKVLIEKMLNYLHTLIQLNEIENNIKINSSLFDLIYETIETIKKLNSYVVICEHKIISLFKSHNLR